MIAHIDADAFFASALLRKRPDLRGKPLLALGMGGGCVIAASYEAKAYGVKTGMTLKDARKLVPRDAIALPADFDEACIASRQLENILQSVCPIVEQMSVDEWFADTESVVGGEPHDLTRWANQLQASMSQQVGLTVSVGIAPSKILAKMASEYRKPAGVTVLGERLPLQTFLEDRPAAAIPGIGPRRSVHTDARGWKTAWDFAQADAELVRKLFGRPGIDLQQELNGICLSSVTVETEPPKSISRCRSFRATGDRDFVYAQLLTHLSRIVLRMRLQDLSCRHVTVWLRNSEMQHWSGDRKLPQPMVTEEALLPYVRLAFDRAWKYGKRCTQIGLGLYGLLPRAAEQYSLFELAQKTDGSEAIQKTLDTLHEKFGRGTVVRAAALSARPEARRDEPGFFGTIATVR